MLSIPGYESALMLAAFLLFVIVFMYLGEIIEAGPADEFFSNPKQQLTKDYIAGSFN